MPIFLIDGRSHMWLSTTTYCAGHYNLRYATVLDTIIWDMSQNTPRVIIGDFHLFTQIKIYRSIIPLHKNLLLELYTYSGRTQACSCTVSRDKDPLMDRQVWQLLDRHTLLSLILYNNELLTSLCVGLKWSLLLLFERSAAMRPSYLVGMANVYSEYTEICLEWT